MAEPLNRVATAIGAGLLAGVAADRPDGTERRARRGCPPRHGVGLVAGDAPRARRRAARVAAAGA